MVVGVEVGVVEVGRWKEKVGGREFEVKLEKRWMKVLRRGGIVVLNMGIVNGIRLCRG